MSSLMDLEYRLNLLQQQVGVALYGQSGQNIPAGGSTGQALVKSSSADYATKWTTNKTVKYSLNIGTVGVRAINPIVFTIVDSDVKSSSMIEAWYSPVVDVANKEYEDDAEFDYLDVRVLPSSITAGSFKVALSARNNQLINNQKTINYRVQNA